MKVRSRAPLRLGLAGGGTDLSPYCDDFGGCVLNATINIYVHAYLDDNVDGNKVIFESKDLGVIEEFSLDCFSSIGEGLILHRAAYKRIMTEFNNGVFIPMRITTQSDAPAGSGLGASSTLVVAILEALRQYLQLPLGEYDLAHLAYEIERCDCRLSGGKQDQYAATFGGFNFIEFYKDDRVIVNPLRMRRYIISELECSLVLFFTGRSRSSAKIIDDQIKSLKNSFEGRLEAMHQLKESSYRVKELLFKGNIEGIAEEFKKSWEYKKATSGSITNSEIDNVERAVVSGGATSIKISGAGGGGFMMIFVKPENKIEIMQILEKIDGKVVPFEFTNEGVYSWTV